MADGPSMDYGYVDRQISSLRSEMYGEINDLRRWTQSEIDRLEREMREIGDMIVSAIDRQTAAVVGGVAATTLMLERTKQQIEEDFSKTRNELELQTESTLQIEIGKKLADASSLKSKLLAFLNDSKVRFDKSIVAVAINRELYNVNFRKIAEEFQSKILTIGQHIFQIRDEDLAPAMKAAEVPLEVTHGLPLEMDMLRLSVRANNLDETLAMLKSSRLDEVLSSLDTLDATLDRYANDCDVPGKDIQIGTELFVTSSSIYAKVLSGREAKTVAAGQAVNLTTAQRDLAFLESDAATRNMLDQIPAGQARDLTGNEIVALSQSAKSLLDRQLISADAYALLIDFLGTGNLKYTEA